MTDVLRVIQLSDTHFLEPGERPEGAHGYNTLSAFDGVLHHVGVHDDFDMVVVTGDVADHGRAAQYEIAAEALGRFSAPVKVCPGNHDFDIPIRAALNRDGLEVPRVIEQGDWSFLFVDSNTGVMLNGDDQHPVDPPGEDRLHNNGLLSEQEMAWIRQQCDAATTANVFIWLHHPPGVEVPLMVNQPYTAQWRTLISDLPQLRGFGGGHTHIPSHFQLDGCQVIVAPSLKNNFDIDGGTWLPPGYRTYEFHADGSINSAAHFIDDEQWPRRPLGRALTSYFAGELTYDQLNEIVARRANR